MGMPMKEQLRRNAEIIEACKAKSRRHGFRKVSQLLRAGAAADVQDADGDTALHKAASQQHADAVGVLQRAMSPEAMELHNRKGVAAREVLERANAAAAAGPT